MPGLRRSTSLSTIPRLSRDPVRQLNVPRAETMGRSSSCSNVLTPSIRLTPRTPSITSSVHKDSKIHDKDWQKRVFLKQIDNRISITLENYKESVPDYLKSFNYPFALEPSIVKSAAVPTSWPYVLQIWIWLIDLIESIQNPERALMQQTTNKDPIKFTFTGIHYMAERFRVSNMQKEKKEEDVDKEFLEKWEEEEIYLNEELKSLKARQAKLALSIQDAEFFTDWSSRPDQQPPMNWGFRRPKRDMLSLRYAKVGNDSVFSRKGLCTLFLSNLLSLLLGAGVGFWLSKYGFIPTIKIR